MACHVFVNAVVLFGGAEDVWPGAMTVCKTHVSGQRSHKEVKRTPWREAQTLNVIKAVGAELDMAYTNHEVDRLYQLPRELGARTSRRLESCGGRDFRGVRGSFLEHRRSDDRTSAQCC